MAADQRWPATLTRRLAVPSVLTITGNFLFKKTPGSDGKGEAGMCGCNVRTIFTSLGWKPHVPVCPPVCTAAIRLLQAPPGRSPGGGALETESQLTPDSAPRTRASHLLAVLSLPSEPKRMLGWASGNKGRLGQRSHLLLLQATDGF